MINKYHIVKLDKLKGVSEGEVRACFVSGKDPFNLKEILKCGLAFTSAGGNGAINVWITDNGELKGELMRYCVVKESTTFNSIKEAKDRISVWMTIINF